MWQRIEMEMKAEAAGKMKEAVSKKDYNLVYITDSNYVLPTKVSIRSAIASAQGEYITIWVVAVELSEDEIRELESLKCPNADVRIQKSASEYEDIGITHPYYPNACLMKFRIHEFFRNLDTVLLVDGDTLLFPGYLSVFDIDISDHSFGAVIDVNIELCKERREFFGHKHYFNAGVLYLNIKRLLEKNPTERLVTYMKNGKLKWYLDQDAFNYVFEDDDVKSLPLAFNMIEYYRNDYTFEALQEIWTDYSLNEIKEMVCHPYVVHFAGPQKPWNSIYISDSETWISYLTDQEYIECSRRFWTDCLLHDSLQTKKIDELRQKLKRIIENHYYELGREILFNDKTIVENDLIEGVYEIEEWGRWTNGNECTMHLNIRKPYKNMILEMEYFVFNNDQIIRLFVNDIILAEYEEKVDHAVRRFLIPKKMIRNGKLILKYVLPGAGSPSAIDNTSDLRVLALGLIRMKIWEDRIRIIPKKTGLI